MSTKRFPENVLNSSFYDLKVLLMQDLHCCTQYFI